MKEWLRINHPDIIRIVRLIRYELECCLAQFCGKLSLRQRATLKYLRDQKRLKLNIASGGPKIDDWVCIDVLSFADIRMDLRRRLPLSNGSASLIFCEHFCDHLNFPMAISRFLAECHRVLEPGGRARFVLHDAEELLRAYLARDTHYFEVGLGQDAASMKIEDVNMLFRFNDFHQFIYDHEMFKSLLRQAGFANVICCKFLQSEINELVLDQDSASREMLSMYLEAIK